MTLTVEQQDVIKAILATMDPRAFQDLLLGEMATITMREAARGEDLVVLPNLFDSHQPDLIANALGQVMMLYDKPLPYIIWWAEYDHDLAQLYFVTTGGEIWPLGVPVHPEVGKYLRFGNKILLVEINDKGEIIRAGERKLMVREYEDQKEIKQAKK